MSDNAISGHTVERINEINWHYYRARLCDEFEYIESKTVKWFLFGPDLEHIGYWSTKTEMLACINILIESKWYSTEEKNRV